MNLHALNVMRGDEALPLCVDILRFGENGKIIDRHESCSDG